MLKENQWQLCRIIFGMESYL